MKVQTFWLALAIVFVLAMPTAFGQNTANGDIYSMSISPAEPVVFDQVTMSVGVTNPSSTTRSYFLEVIVSKDGEIKSSQPFTFTLNPGLGTFVSPTFVTDDIGQYEIVAKLSDNIQAELMDIEVRTINVVSEIGPFDIAIDSPSEVIIPGTRTPLILTLANMGEKATDVQVQVILECFNQPDIEQSLFIFLFPGAIQDKTIATDTCQETGAHDITASVIVFNKTWITAVNQIFLNESFIELEFDLPESLIVRAGESRIFDLKVTNQGNTPINNLRVFIPKIPDAWLKIIPTSIIQVGQGQTVLFLVNITPPIDTPDTDVLIGVNAAADQVLKRKETPLKVVSFEGELPSEAGVTRPPTGVPIDLSNFFGANGLYIGIGIVAAVGGLVAALRFRRGRSVYHSRSERQQESGGSEKLRRVAETLKKKK